MRRIVQWGDMPIARNVLKSVDSLSDGAKSLDLVVVVPVDL